ncbi:hypothetical protein [Singulisphaera sp. PoT]|uniref:hypothetical protein n=1 Tax=Singulisphaera sp. PoT TaxID=3411797 RepID=UPI003BF4A338
MEQAPPLHLCGWVDDPNRHAVARTLPFRTLAQANPNLRASGNDIFLYKAWKDALGSYPSYVAQQIGDCTSFGSGHAVDLLQCIEMVIGKEPIVYKETCTEAIYGLGRKVGGMLGSYSDGCYGVAVAKALTDYGAVPRELVGSYSGDRAKKWGYSGVPDDIVKHAADFKLGAATLVTTLDMLDAALENLYPAAGGFSQGFEMTRNADGVCRQSGSWGHEQACVGKRTKNGRRQYLLVQSWGDQLPSGPLSDDQPSWSFWIDESSMASILSQNDFLTFAKFPGFERREPPASWTYADASLI